MLEHDTNNIGFQENRQYVGLAKSGQSMQLKITVPQVIGEIGLLSSRSRQRGHL
jgi:hypothetical protein